MALEEYEDGGVAKTFLGPPPPSWFTWLTRACEFTTFILVAVWVFKDLGGLAFRAVSTDQGSTTSGIFNWHPLLMSLAFPVLMAEAVLAYRAPLGPALDRPQRKQLHAALHSLALVCIVGAVAAAISSHNLAVPVIPNFYSPHSWLGISTLTVIVAQYLVGLYAYLFPKLAIRNRRALGPIHQFAGRAAFTAGLATMAVGVQEKTTFVQNGMQLKGAALYSSVIQLAAAIQVFLFVTGILVLYHHAAPSAVNKRSNDNSELLPDVISQEA
ncbi:hypothetical protein ABBQ38_005996 [Trebouxia sp. C0009 RCD-2024]